MTNPTDNQVKLAGEVQKLLVLLASFPSPVDWEAVQKISEEIQRIAEGAQNDDRKKSFLDLP